MGPRYEPKHTNIVISTSHCERKRVAARTM